MYNFISKPKNFDISKFKVGDKVRRLETSSGLKAGDVYTIAEINVNRYAFVLRGILHSSYDAYRFELVEDDKCFICGEKFEDIITDTNYKFKISVESPNGEGGYVCAVCIRDVLG